MQGMDVIDGNWIKARLADRHGAKKALADAVGIDTHKLAKILNGTRRVQAHEIPRIMDFFRGTQDGFKDSAAPFAGAPFADEVSANDRIRDLAATICPNVRRPFLYQARRSELAAGIVSGDFLVMSHGAESGDDILVIVSLPGDAWSGTNELRRCAAGMLLSLDPWSGAPPLHIDTSDAAVVGTVRAVIRAPEVEKISSG